MYWLSVMITNWKYFLFKIAVSITEPVSMPNYKEDRITPLIFVQLHDESRIKIYLDEIQNIKQLLMGSRITILVNGKIKYANTSYSKDLIDLLKQTATENWQNGANSIVIALKPIEALKE